MSAKAGKMDGAKAGKATMIETTDEMTGISDEVPPISAKAGKETTDEMTVSGKSSKAPMVVSKASH